MGGTTTSTGSRPSSTRCATARNTASLTCGYAVADEALVDAGAQAAYVFTNAGHVVGHGPTAGGRVVRVMPGDDAQMAAASLVPRR